MKLPRFFLWLFAIPPVVGKTYRYDDDPFKPAASRVVAVNGNYVAWQYLLPIPDDKTRIDNSGTIRTFWTIYTPSKES